MTTEAIPLQIVWSDPSDQANPPHVFSEEEKKRLISQQLGLLIHAYKCTSSDCPSPQCSVMKAILEHLPGCKAHQDCPIRHCYSSRQIILHWGNCKIPDCQVCGFFRRSPDPKENHKTFVVRSKEEKKRLIQKNLVLLLHANMCDQRANHRCHSPECQVMKQVLRHMKTCKKGDSCTRAHCKTSKFIIGHWRRCKLHTCDVCAPIRQALRNLQWGSRFQGPAQAA